MQIGEIVITLGCACNAEGCEEHPAVVTRVWSATEINCVVLVDSPTFTTMVEQHLRHESVQLTGKRFKLRGA